MTYLAFQADIDHVYFMDFFISHATAIIRQIKIWLKFVCGFFVEWTLFFCIVFFLALLDEYKHYLNPFILVVFFLESHDKSRNAAILYAYFTTVIVVRPLN